MLYLFCTEVAVLCGSIESIHYAIFVLYRSGCLMWLYRVNTLCYICFVQKWLSNVALSSQYIMLYFFVQKWLSYVALSSQYIMLFFLYRSGCLMWLYRVNTLCYICFVQKWLSYVALSSQYIMLYFFVQKWLSYVALSSQYIMLYFFLYRSGCLMWLYRVNTLCYICFVQKWLSYVAQSSQYIMLYLFCTEVAVLCGSIESIHYAISILYRRVCISFFLSILVRS